MTAPANIALFTVALDNIGPARAILTLAERLDRRRFTPHVLTALPLDPAVASTLADLRVPAAALGTRSAFDARACWRLIRQLRRWRIDLVHARLQRAGLLARMAGPFAGRPIVLVNVVNMYSNHFTSQHGARMGRPLLWVERATRMLVQRWVANSVAAANDLESVISVPAASVPIVSNAVDLSSFIPSADVRSRMRREIGAAADDRIVGVVTRLVPLKRVEMLIDAIAELRHAGIPARLLIVGDGPSRAALEEHARRLDAGTIFLGHRTDVSAILSAMDVFAFTSSSEGQPNVILEAMAAGLPVVAIGIPGLDEVVAAGETGELVDGGFEAFGMALARVLTDPERAARMGRAGRARAELLFSPDRMVRQFEAIYEAALSMRAS